MGTGNQNCRGARRFHQVSTISFCVPSRRNGNANPRLGSAPRIVPEEQAIKLLVPFFSYRSVIGVPRSQQAPLLAFWLNYLVQHKARTLPQHMFRRGW